MQINETAMLRYDPEHHREAKTGALTDLLGSEERVKYLEPGLCIHAVTGIRNRYHGTVANHTMTVSSNVPCLHTLSRYGDAESAAARHCIPRVGGQIEQYLLNLNFVDKHMDRVIR